MLFGEFLGSMFLKIPNGINGLTFAFVIMGCGVMILLYDFLNFDLKMKICSSQKIFPMRKQVEPQKSHYKEIHFKMISNSPNNNLKDVSHHSAENTIKINFDKICRHSLRWSQFSIKDSWKMISKPCMHKMKYKQKINRENMASIVKSNTVVQRSIDETILHMTIFSKNQYNQQKTVGGDSWKITVKSVTISFIADMVDNNDGTYESFIEVPRKGVYNVTLTLLHSICESFMDPPEDFFKIGKNLSEA